MLRRNYLVFAAFGICVLFLPLYHHLLYFSDHTCPGTVDRNLNLPETETRDFVETLLEMTRSMIKLEMWDYNFTHSVRQRAFMLFNMDKLEDLLMEAGGAPVRSAIVSAWRSGSNFFADLLDAVPGTFYTHEPIAVFTLDHMIRGPPYEARANHLIRNILRCNLDSDIVDYYAFAKENVKEIDLIKRNKRFWEKCNLKPELCFDAEVGTKFCKLFPFHAMKLDRFRLPRLRTLMEDKELNVKIVLLVRDPRGVLRSRLHIKDFCSAHRHDNYTGPYEAVPECADPGVVCSDMVQDYQAAVDFLKRYPGRFMAIRFEDLALNLEGSARAVLGLLGLEYSPPVAEFLRTHSHNRSDSRDFSTVRVSRDVPFKWKHLLTFDEVREIQEKCGAAMSLWGYEVAQNASHMASGAFYPLTSYTVR